MPTSASGSSRSLSSRSASFSRSSTPLSAVCPQLVPSVPATRLNRSQTDAFTSIPHRFPSGCCTSILTIFSMLCSFFWCIAYTPISSPNAGSLISERYGKQPHPQFLLSSSIQQTIRKIVRFVGRDSAAERRVFRQCRARVVMLGRYNFCQ